MEAFGNLQARRSRQLIATQTGGQGRAIVHMQIDAPELQNGEQMRQKLVIADKRRVMGGFAGIAEGDGLHPGVR